MPIWHIIILAIIQGLAELLPVSSSAHVIVAEKLLHYHADDPKMTLLLVMLHTGTMFAVIVYFWKQWRQTYFSSKPAFIDFALRAAFATLFTGIIGYPIIKGIEQTLGTGLEKGEIEQIFDRLNWIAPALAAGGCLILFSGLRERAAARQRAVGVREAAWIGAVQGLCLPFRGFSRSGATISTGLLLGSVKARVEQFSFALAVIITPPVVARETLRFIKAQHAAGNATLPMSLFMPSLFGLVFSFLAGLIALKWLSRWLENGKWYYFGVYCLVAAVVVEWMYIRGY